MKDLLRWALVLLLLGFSSLVFTGCADDLYGQCTIDSEDLWLRECATGENTSCIVEEQLECQTRTCGRYRGSTPFCTIECTEDGDCPNGECREFVFQSGQRHCVATIDIP